MRLDVTDGVLRQRAAPPLHMPVDRVGEVGSEDRPRVCDHGADEVVVVSLQHGDLAGPAERGAQKDDVLGVLGSQAHFVELKVAALMASGSTGGTRKPEPPSRTAADRGSARVTMATDA